MKCYYHPEAEAVATCAKCGKAICQSCAVDVAGKIYCQKCLATGTAAKSQTVGATSVPTNTMALISVITGVVGILGLPSCCCSPVITGGWLLLFAVPAAITGWIARNQITESRGQQGGEGLAMAGLIMGIAEIAIALFFICLFVVSMAGLVTLPALQNIIPTPSF